MRRLLLLCGVIAALIALGAIAASTAAAEEETGPSSYLCWNHEMVNPVEYVDSVADEMWTTGRYIEPQAILRNVEGGTNIGAYHLVCNAPSTMKATGFSIGGSGELYSPEVVALYNAEHLVTHNDLNQYHVFS